MFSRSSKVCVLMFENVRAQPDAVNTGYSPYMETSYLGTSPFSVANNVAAAREDTPILR